MSLNSPVLDRSVLDRLPQVEADLYYLVPMAEKPVNYTYEPPSGIPRYNGNYETRRLPLRNARGIAQDLSLDREGFALVAHSSSVRDFYDDEEVRRVYYPEAEKLLAT